MFDIQDEIIEQVVARIGDAYGSISQRLFRASRVKPRHDLSLYEAVFAYYHYERHLDQTAHDSMLAMFEHAVEVEPLYAMAWAILSTLHCLTADSNPSAPASLLDRAEDCVQRAILLEPNCQQAYSSSAHIGVLTRDYSRITMACNKIFQLNPHAAYMVGAAAVWLAIAGQFDQAIQFLEHSRKLNPLYPGWFNAVYWFQSFANQDYERALWAVQQFAIPHYFWDPLARAISHGRLGHRQPAAKAYQELLKLLPDFAVRPAYYLSCYIHSEETLTDMLKGLKVAGLAARQER